MSSYSWEGQRGRGSQGNIRGEGREAERKKARVRDEEREGVERRIKILRESVGWREN